MLLKFYIPEGMEIRPRIEIFFPFSTFHDSLNLKNQKKNQMLQYFYMWAIDAIKFFSLFVNFEKFQFFGIISRTLRDTAMEEINGIFSHF